MYPILQKQIFLQDRPARLDHQEKRDFRVRPASPAWTVSKVPKVTSVQPDLPDYQDYRDRSVRPVCRVFKALLVHQALSVSLVRLAKRHLTISPVICWSSIVKVKPYQFAKLATLSFGKDTVYSTPMVTKERILKI